jgi:hypothetical protein
VSFIIHERTQLRITCQFRPGCHVRQLWSHRTMIACNPNLVVCLIPKKPFKDVASLGFDFGNLRVSSLPASVAIADGFSFDCESDMPLLLGCCVCIKMVRRIPEPRKLGSASAQPAHHPRVAEVALSFARDPCKVTGLRLFGVERRVVVGRRKSNHLDRL